MIKEHDRVVLTESVPAEGLEPGDVGTVVHLSTDGKAYEVEFVAPRRPHTSGRDVGSPPGAVPYPATT